MAITTYGRNLKTNLNKDTEAFEWLQEINYLFGEEKYIITITSVIDGTIFNRNRKVGEYYSIYYKIDNCEYQCIMSSKSLNYQAVESYLLGILSGIKFVNDGAFKSQ